MCLLAEKPSLLAVASVGMYYPTSTYENIVVEHSQDIKNQMYKDEVLCCFWHLSGSCTMVHNSE